MGRRNTKEVVQIFRITLLAEIPSIDDKTAFDRMDEMAHFLRTGCQACEIVNIEPEKLKERAFDYYSTLADLEYDQHLVMPITVIARKGRLFLVRKQKRDKG